MSGPWKGWLRRRGIWELLAEAATIGQCAKAVDAELRRRGLRVPNRAICLTAHGSPPVDRPAAATTRRKTVQGERHDAQTAKATLDRLDAQNAPRTL